MEELGYEGTVYLWVKSSQSLGEWILTGKLDVCVCVCVCQKLDGQGH